MVSEVLVSDFIQTFCVIKTGQSIVSILSGSRLPTRRNTVLQELQFGANRVFRTNHS